MAITTKRKSIVSRISSSRRTYMLQKKKQEQNSTPSKEQVSPHQPPND